jgi:hypothetical protein
MSAFKRFVPAALATAAAAAAVAAALAAAGTASASPQAPAVQAVQAAPAARQAPAAFHGWTITGGGNITAVASSASVRDITAGRTVSCYLSSMTIHAKSGRLTSGASAALVNKASFGPCLTRHVMPVKVSLGAFPWHVNLSSYNASTGVTTGTLTGLHIAISVPLLGCTAVADGTGPDAHNGLLAASYRNKTGVLAARGAGSGNRLRVYRASHCDDLIKNGDVVVLSANYSVHPRQKITHS